MVNENNGKTYTPTPVYNRKMMRTMLRNAVLKRVGYHNVSTIMSKAFKELKEKENDDVQAGTD